MKFIAFTRGWADELTVYGFALMTTEEWNEYSEKLKNSASLTWYFGTNEGYDDEKGSDYLADMEVSDVTSEEADAIKRIFDLTKFDWEHFYSWGNFPDFDFDDDGIVEDEW